MTIYPHAALLTSILESYARNDSIGAEIMVAANDAETLEDLGFVEVDMSKYKRKKSDAWPVRLTYEGRVACPPFRWVSEVSDNRVGCGECHGTGENVRWTYNYVECASCNGYGEHL